MLKRKRKKSQRILENNLASKEKMRQVEIWLTALSKK
jgi:hypothetical protein